MLWWGVKLKKSSCDYLVRMCAIVSSAIHEIPSATPRNDSYQDKPYCEGGKRPRWSQAEIPRFVGNEIQTSYF